MPHISSFERQAVEKRLEVLKTELYQLHERDDFSQHKRVARLRALLHEIAALNKRLEQASQLETSRN